MLSTAVLNFPIACCMKVVLYELPWLISKLLCQKCKSSSVVKALKGQSHKVNTVVNESIYQKKQIHQQWTPYPLWFKSKTSRVTGSMSMFGGRQTCYRPKQFDLGIIDTNDVVSSDWFRPNYMVKYWRLFFLSVTIVTQFVSIII